MKLSNRRKFLHLAAGAAALPALPLIASAQAYPSRPVRILVGFAAGGPNDILARLIGQWLSERLGQTFVVENKPGSSGNIAIDTLVRSPADGYTLLVAPTNLSIVPAMYEKLNFDVSRDLAPVASIIRVASILVVNPAVPATTVPELIAYAKANPGKINMASPGVGTAPHVSGELFKMLAGVDMVHVPYRGNAPAFNDLVAGQVQVMFASPVGLIEHIQTGKLRALATTSAFRSDTQLNLPAIGQFVPSYEASSWYGVIAPRATPTQVIEKLNQEINSGLADPKLQARLAQFGGAPFFGSAAEFEKFIGAETEKWSKVIRAANIKAE
jgi:tripartite-type tricarboxylate transporter receptor subunit TctC